MTKSKKYARMNLTLEVDFYQYLIRKAEEEHLPTSTFVKKYLMDRMKDYKSGNSGINEDM